MPAPEDNNYAQKFPTPESRKLLCSSYIAHIESGLSDECFPDCDPQTFRRYLKDYAEDFDTDLIEVARRKRQLFWERAGRDGTMGEIKGFNAMSWKFNMGNRFGWKDKREDTVKLQKDGAADLAAAMLGQRDDPEPEPATEGADA